MSFMFGIEWAALIPRGSKAGKPTIELNSQPVGMERLGKNVVVGCMDETLQCFTSKVVFCYILELIALVENIFIIFKIYTI